MSLGAHGFVLVDVDAQRNMQVHSIEIDLVRYSVQEIDADDVALGRDLRQLLAKRVARLQSEGAGGTYWSSGESTWIWRMRGRRPQCSGGSARVAATRVWARAAELLVDRHRDLATQRTARQVEGRRHDPGRLPCEPRPRIARIKASN
jgi:hypothetical protein